MDTIISLNRISFLGKFGLRVNGRGTGQKRWSAAPPRVVANAARKGEMNGGVVIETVAEAKEVVELKSTVGSGDRDVYGEDAASEDQSVTPWSVSVGRFVCKEE